MADQKISELNELDATPASDDELAIVDTSDSETKRITPVNLLGSALKNVVEDTTPQLGGDLDVNEKAIQDGDGDTKIQLEESADEDIVRFDTAGTERMQIAADGSVTITTQEIADNHVLSVDDASAADDDLCYFTANGIEGVAITGATLPSAGKAGRFFCHSTTGRKIVYQDNGSAWVPIISLAALTLYVDKTDGTDDLNHGTGVDSDAFATFGYAVDAIPGLRSGNVYIYLNDEDYSGEGTITIQGKNATGNYGIYIYGTLSSLISGTTDNEAVYNYEGDDAACAVIYDSGDFGADYGNKLAYIDSTDYRIIDRMCYSMGFEAGQNGMEPDRGEAIKGDTSGAWGRVVYVDTQGGAWATSDASGVIYYIPISGTFQDDETVDVMADSSTTTHNNAFNVEADNGAIGQDTNLAALCGAPLTSTPQNDSYVIYDWGTTIGDLTIKDGQLAVYIYDLYCAGDIYVYNVGSTDIYRVKAESIYGEAFANIYMSDCLCTGGAEAGIKSKAYSRIRCLGVKSSTSIARSLFLQERAEISIYQGCIIEGATHGIHLQGNSYLGSFSSGVYNFIQGNTNGIYATSGGWGFTMSYNSYANNTTDENTDATSTLA
jgi:hypothetical protein